MEFERISIERDYIVIGAGMSGICTAIQAARLGLSVALINNRSFLGGNASAEMGVIVNGATGSQEFNYHARETGIIEELLLENLHRNPQGNRYIWDTVLMDYVRREPNITLFLHTNVDEVIMDGTKIEMVSGAQQGTEKRFDFRGALFFDGTGDGTIGYLAGAEYMMGREAKDEFNERIAPDEADHYVLPSTLIFTSKDTGKPVKFIAPDFALDIEKSGVLEYREISERFNFTWYYEVGGELDQIKDNEEIIQKHRELIYGIWDYIKNSGKYDTETRDLEYIAGVPGKRESRRLVGDYILTENDITSRRDFEDTVAYGGWSIDLHAVDGFFSKELKNHHIYLKGIFQIPYRAGYSKNIGNLFLGGRTMSASHVAFGSTRVMSTLAVFGEALACAAYLCKKHEAVPRDIYERYLAELKQLLVKNDHYVIGEPLLDEDNLVRDATIHVSSTRDLELTVPGEYSVLEKNRGLSLPLNGWVESLSLWGKSDKDTQLEYEIYMPAKREAYSPDHLILSNSVKVPASEEGQWIRLPVETVIDRSFVFLNLKANENIKIGTTEDRLTGVISSEEEAINNPHAVDIQTLEQKETFRYESLSTPCFTVEPKQNTYHGDNVKDGWLRPYGSPNLWISDNKVAGEWLQIQFEETKRVNELVLIFNSDLNTRYMNTVRTEFDAFDPIVQDYQVFSKQGNTYQLVTEVKGNYQRVNRLHFEPIETSEIKIVFGSTQGSSSVELYEVLCFSPAGIAESIAVSAEEI